MFKDWVQCKIELRLWIHCKNMYQHSTPAISKQGTLKHIQNLDFNSKFNLSSLTRYLIYYSQTKITVDIRIWWISLKKYILRKRHLEMDIVVLMETRNTKVKTRFCFYKELNYGLNSVENERKYFYEMIKGSFSK